MKSTNTKINNKLINSNIRSSPEFIDNKSKARLKSYKRLIDRVLRWGSEIFGWKQPSISVSGRTVNLIDLIWEPILSCTSVEETRTTLNTWKGIRVWFMKLLGEDTVQRKVLLSNPPKGVKPEHILFVKKWLGENTTVERRAWTTSLFSTRIIKLPEVLDTSSITKASDKLTPSYKEEIKSFWKTLRYTKCDQVPKGVRWTDWHLSSKQGPNGFVLHSLFRDFNSIDEVTRQHLENLGGERFKECMQTLTQLKPFFSETNIPTDPGILRKIIHFSDLEGKTRVVAILDYFSQSVLRPLHHYLFKILRRIPQDFTFDQGGFKDHIKDWDQFYSCDLTTATDRFPLKVISELLQGILPKSYVDSWEYIMVSLPFRSPEGEDLSYARGNPMGAYSSWSSFTVAHHFVMFYCSRKLGLDWRTAKYAILGDDILVGDTALYREYRKVLSDLDVPVSEAKTHESKILCEFAKRWIYRGEEISPFPIPAMGEARNYAFLSSLLVAEKVRGHDCDVPSATRVWFDLKYRMGFRLCTRPRSGFFTDLYLKSYISEQLILTFRKQQTWSDLFKAIHFRVHARCVEPYMDEAWIESFWVNYLRSEWLNQKDLKTLLSLSDPEVYTSEPDDTYQGLRPLDECEVVKRKMMFNCLTMGGRGLVDMMQVPWVQLADQITARNDEEVEDLMFRLLTQDFSSLEGWETIRGLVLPDVATTFRGRKYEIQNLLSGRLSSDLLAVFRRGKVVEPYFHKFGHMDLNDLLDGKVKESGKVDIFSCLLNITSWEGEPH